MSVGVAGEERGRTVVARFEVGGGEGGVEIDVGAHKDYAELERFHYRAGRPATRVRVLAARDRESGELAGVLVVSMPTLNGRWRRALWGERFAGPDRKRSAARINKELRTLSRVIVDPRYRGLGVATGLVRAYLSRPMTVATEAVAAMGWCYPFFEAAGMRVVDVPASERDRRFELDLRRAGIRAWELMDIGRARRAMAESADVAAAVARWARTGKEPPRWARSVDGRRTWRAAVLAAGSAAGRMVAYGCDQRWGVGECSVFRTGD